MKKLQLQKKSLFFWRILSKKERRKRAQSHEQTPYSCRTRDVKPTKSPLFLKVHRRRIWRIKNRCPQDDLSTSLEEKPGSGQPVRHTQKHEAKMIVLACTTAPQGRKRWALQLLAENLKKKPGFKTISHDSVRLILKKVNLSPV